MTKTDTTPIVMLTLQDLRDGIREEMGSSVNVTNESEKAWEDYRREGRERKEREKALLEEVNSVCPQSRQKRS